jgi:anti-sigma B factor antagonist
VEPGSAGCARVSLSGELDLSTSPVLRSTLDELIASGPTTISLDLTGLAFIDSIGLRSITSSADRAEVLGGGFLLDGCSTIVRRFLALTASSQLRASRHELDHADVNRPPGASVLETARQPSHRAP